MPVQPINNSSDGGSTAVVSGDNLFTADLMSSGDRSHTLNDQDQLEFIKLTPLGDQEYLFRIGNGVFEVDSREYSGATLLDRGRFIVGAGGVNESYSGFGTYTINGSAGLPRQRRISNGNNAQPSYGSPSVVDAVAQLDFNADEPTLGFGINGNYYWNTTATPTRPVGLYAVVPSFDTLSGFDFELQTDETLVRIDGEVFSSFNGALNPIGGLGVQVQPPLFEGFSVSNAGGRQSAGSFTATCSGEYTFRFSGTGFTGSSGAILYVGATQGTQDLFNGEGDRLFTATPEKEYAISLESGQEIFIDFFAGGGSSAANLILDVIAPADCIQVPRQEEDRVLNLVNEPTGIYQVHFSDFSDAPVSLPNNIVLGFDLTSMSGMELIINPEDDLTNQRNWAKQQIDVDDLLRNFASGSPADASVHIFDNDFLNINVIDPLTGELSITDSGREVRILNIEVRAPITSVRNRIDVITGAGVVLTPSYADIGAVNPELSGVRDGDIVLITYGDGTRAQGIFLDNEANVAREGGLATGVQIVDSNQVQVRALVGGNSGIDSITILTNKLAPLIPLPYLPAGQPVTYEDTVDGQFYDLTEYSNTATSIWNQLNADGSFTRLFAIPSTYILKTSLEPTLPLDTDGATSTFFNKDVDTFAVNFRSNVGSAINLEIFVESVPYADIPDLVLPTIANGVITYENRVNSDGTYNHLFSMQLAPNENPSNITSGLLFPAGNNNNGSNPPTFHYELA